MFGMREFRNYYWLVGNVTMKNIWKPDVDEIKGLIHLK